jgi:hypothetical protein
MRSNSDVLSELDVKATLRLLRGVERLPEGAHGALVFGTKDERLGTMLVEDRRVCWAAASGMETRLTDILQRQTRPPIDPVLIERVFARCRADGAPLGAALVAQGVVTPAGLKRALREHTAEAVVRLSALLNKRERFAPVWQPNRARKYDAQFTFAPAEILVCVRTLGGGDVGSAYRCLLPVGEACVAAAVFSPGTLDRDLLPLAQVNGETIGVEGLVQLGGWARSAVASASAFASGESLLAATNAFHQTVVLWAAENLVCTALCEDRSALSLVMARRIRGGPED